MHVQNYVHLIGIRVLKAEAVPLLIFSGCLAITLWLVQSFSLPQWNFLLTNQRREKNIEVRTSKIGFEAITKDITGKRESLDRIYRNLSCGGKDAGEPSAMLEMLIAKAREAGINIDKIQPQDAADAHQALFPVMLVMTTRYPALGKFISSLEALPQRVSIDRLAITAQKGQTLEARVMVTCFLQQKK